MAACPTAGGRGNTDFFFIEPIEGNSGTVVRCRKIADLRHHRDGALTSFWPIPRQPLVTMEKRGLAPQLRA